MADIKPSTPSLFLREEELRKGTELLYFAYRDFIAEPDDALRKYGFGRAHHRVLHFVARRPGLSVADLLDLLSITKQSLSRVLGTLVGQGYVRQEKGTRDRRQRLLYLTEKGSALEAELAAIQRRRMARAYREAGADAVAGFWRVLAGLIDESRREEIERFVNEA
ncbi:MAG: MarR family transcriptional regulator [Alphaproteobacteria bacterium]|nr:MAG: MarR family transcriptional regulator [Alphaproteobacteria bacterium]